MYCHILLGILTISFCLGENSNMAKSAVSFHRDDADASLSYTYSYNNIHPSSLKPHVNHTRPKFYKEVQYAPLVSNHINQHKNDGTRTKAVAYQRNDIKNVTKNEYLEPQVYGSANGYANRQFISGYNIDVPKLNNFVYNTIKSEHKNVATRKQFMNSFQKNTKNITPKKHKLSQDHFDNLMVFKSIKHQKFPSKSTLEILSMLENPQIHPVFNPDVKVPQLHLNVARAFNFAHNPIQAPLIEHKKWQQNYKHGQGNHIDKQALLKTILYPMN